MTMIRVETMKTDAKKFADARATDARAAAANAADYAADAAGAARAAAWADAAAKTADGAIAVPGMDLFTKAGINVGPCPGYMITQNGNASEWTVVAGFRICDCYSARKAAPAFTVETDGKALAKAHKIAAAEKS